MSDVHSTARRASLRVVNPLGMELHVDVSGVEDAYAAMRTFGRMGWHSSDIQLPLELPFAMADLFDWSLIGAYKFTGKNKEDGSDVEMVAYRGKFYKRRDIAERREHGKVMPAAVFFSRGASEDDPEEDREGAKGDNRGYIPLAKFKGAGKVVEAYCTPKHRATQQPATQPATKHQQKTSRFDPSTDPAPTERDRNLLRSDAAARGIDLDSDQVREIVRKCTEGPLGVTTDLEQITQQEAFRIIANIKALRQPLKDAPAPAASPEQRPAPVIGAGDRQPDGVVKNVTIALERAGYSGDALGNLVAETSSRVDGSVTYEIARLSMAAVNELLAISKRSRVG